MPHAGHLSDVPGRRDQTGSLTLDGATLAALGSMRVPKHLWTALQRFAAWIEPALMCEWTRLMQGYATSQERLLDVGPWRRR